MSKQTAPDWLSVNEAAVYFGKSLSFIRRAIPELEERAPEQIRREPIPHKGGNKILLNRAYLVQLFGAKEPEPEPPGDEERAGANLPAGVDFPSLVGILERQINAKDRQIENLQRDAESKSRQIEQEQQTVAELSERLRDTALLNAGLQNKLLALTEKVAERPEPLPTAPAGVAPQERRESVLSSPVYFIAVAVAASLIVGLLLYLVLS